MRGEAIYRRKELTCMKCHAVAGVGGLVGPDLGSIGASAQVDYLIESVLVPNKAVKENYHSWLVATKDGKFFTGIKARESSTEWVLRDAEDREIRIPTANIEEKSIAPSLMPEGLADTLTQNEFLDLVRFLSELGKVGRFSAPPNRLVRRWQALEPTPAARQLIRSRTMAFAAENLPDLVWNTLYARVDGSLPTAEIPKFKLPLPPATTNRSIAILRCEVDVTTPGKVACKAGARVPLGRLVEAPLPFRFRSPWFVTLALGRNVLTVAYDLTEPKAAVSMEIVAATGSPVKFQILGGK